MSPSDQAPHLIGLAGGWVLWCCLHSLLIWPSVAETIQRLFGPSGENIYRLCYNLLSGLSLVPLLWYEDRLGGTALWQWNGATALVRAGMIGLGIWLLWAGARVYPMRHFLGLTQLHETEPAKAPSLEMRGILRWVRHPWYCAGFLLLWARGATPPALVTASVLSLYLVVGARLEEIKLMRLFGPAYTRYQRDVGMFFPRFKRKRLP